VNQQAAYKSIFGTQAKAILNPEQAGRFLRVATEQQQILKEANVFSMKSHTKNLDRVSIDGRVLTSGYDASGVTRALADNEKVAITNYQNQLVAKKLKTQAVIEDDELEDNLEGKAFANTLIDLQGEKIGYDMEVWGVWANKANIAYGTDKLLNSTEGWLSKAGNKIYGDGAGADFDPADPESLFKALIEATPKKYIRNRSQMRFYVPFAIEDAYRDILADRGTALGDTTTTGYNGLAYRNIPVVNPDSLDDTAAQALWTTKAAMLSNPSNLQCGIWRQISMEPDRNAQLEQTEYVTTMRGDVHYTNEFEGAAAFFDLEDPA
ncbi:MAG: phage major capsid protein, partial [bacterium]|nr:phage major capsid protein [bacterium]